MDALGHDRVKLAVEYTTDGHPVGDSIGATADAFADDARFDVSTADPDLAEGLDEDVGLLTGTEVVVREAPEPAHAELTFVVDTDPRPVVERVNLDRHGAVESAGLPEGVGRRPSAVHPIQ